MPNCLTSLYGLLTGTPDQSGKWEFTSTTNGGNSVDLFFSTDAPGASSTTVTVNTQIAGPETTPARPYDVLVSFDDADPGDYVFTYKLGGSGTCSDEQIVTVTVADGVYSGPTGNMVEICNDDETEYHILNLFLTGNTTPNTSISDNSTAISTTGTMAIPAGWPAASWIEGNPGFLANGKIKVDNGGTLPPPDDYVFEYLVTANNASCTNCSSTSTLTVSVIAASNAGGEGSITVCNLHPGVPAV